MVVLLSSFLAFHYSQNAGHAAQELNQERYLRMVSEENLQKANKRIASLESDLEKIQNKIKSFERLIEQNTAINNDLKTRLENASQVKDELEQKLKELKQVSGVPATPTP